MRIYSNYSSDEVAAIEKAAAERGYSLSAFQRISLLKVIGIKQPVDEQALINKMHDEIKKLAPESISFDKTHLTFSPPDNTCTFF